jgi:hypothetical protein
VRWESLTPRSEPEFTPFEENTAGSSYLSRLKQRGSGQPAAATAAAPEPPPAADFPSRDLSTIPQNSARTEKRRSPRSKCKGSARLQPSDSAVSTWATLADISLQGCYIETPAPYRVGAMLSLTLDGNGFRVETTAEVRVVYPGLGMGLQFKRMSEADRGRLSELVKSISQPAAIPGAKAVQSAPKSDAPRAVTNADAALQAIFSFFEDRHTMGREEFHKIVRQPR